ncbi:MAG: hypothetical protein JWR10_3973 [Rubritepida sp.]|nr:hypothetical protein [Rubritepida sp.]
MRGLDIGVSLFWVLFGLALGQQSVALGLSGPGGPGSGMFPLLAALLIFAGGAGSLVQSLLRRGAALSDDTVEARFWPEPGSAMRVGLLVFVMAAMIFAVPYAGFALSGAVGMPLLLRTIAPNFSWWLAALVGIVAAACVHLLFAVLLGTPLPRGPLGF